MRFGLSLPLHGSAVHPEGAEMSGTGPSDAQRFGERFDHNLHALRIVESFEHRLTA